MLRVMVVDDALYMRVTYRNMLQGSDVEIAAEAENGDEAIAMYERVKPDVVLLDLTMPGMSGQEVLRRIMELDRKARVIVVSAMGQEIFIKECLQLGAKSFMIKPFKEKALLNMLGL
ncbi:MAG: response regulator [Clostridia bacterium]|nr:response regulator [Clostridia bacterium]